MTLPQTISASLKFENLIPYILENFNYMDSSIPKYKCITFTRDLTAANGYVSYTSVGFSPTSIIFFAIEPVSGATSWGISSNNANVGTYMPGYKSLCVYKQDIGGIYFSNQGSITMYNNSRTHHGRFSEQITDGFKMYWVSVLGGTTGTATIIAFCIR